MKLSENASQATHRGARATKARNAFRSKKNLMYASPSPLYTKKTALGEKCASDRERLFICTCVHEVLGTSEAIHNKIIAFLDPELVCGASLQLQQGRNHSAPCHPPLTSSNVPTVGCDR